MKNFNLLLMVVFFAYILCIVLLRLRLSRIKDDQLQWGVKHTTILDKTSSNEFYNDKNLLEAECLNTHGIKKKLLNNDYINKYWWIRIDEKSQITFEGSTNELSVEVKTLHSKNIYFNYSIDNSAIRLDHFIGKPLRLTAEVYTDVGSISISLGGVGREGYHHDVSDNSTTGEWTKLSVQKVFYTFNEKHKDALFIRINPAIDLLPKRIIIKNIQLMIVK